LNRTLSADFAADSPYFLGLPARNVSANTKISQNVSASNSATEQLEKAKNMSFDT